MLSEKIFDLNTVEITKKKKEEVSQPEKAEEA